jgi:two-component system sensor histidine kinase UhpB
VQIDTRNLLDTSNVKAQPLLAALFEGAPHGIAMTDLAGRYVRANPAFQRLLGYTEQELLRKTVHDLTHPEDREQNCPLLADETRYLRKDGSVMWARNTVTLIAGQDGEPGGIVAVVEDISERRRAEARELQEERALLLAAQKLQELARRLVEAEELQRRRIAGELHDRVGQTLSALNINLDIALGMLAEPSGGERPELKLRLADSLALVDGTLQTIENLMAELRPPLLDEYGLSAALAMHVKEFAQRTGLRVSVEDPEELGPSLRQDAAIALFRIAQEALANVAKHAKASRVKIALERQDGATVLSITDDGLGFDVDERLAHRTRWGVTTMQERAAAVGAELYLESAPGTGTTIRVTVPAP